jgi:WD40 repeat protein
VKKINLFVLFVSAFFFNSSESAEIRTHVGFPSNLSNSFLYRNLFQNSQLNDQILKQLLEVSSASFPEFPIKVIHSNNGKNIYQIAANTQFNTSNTYIDKLNYGPFGSATLIKSSGSHAFKNSLFAAMALDAYARQNIDNFISFSENLNNLTDATIWLFKKIDNVLKLRNNQLFSRKLSNPVLDVKDVEYINDEIRHLADCGIKDRLPFVIAIPFLDSGTNIDKILIGEYGGPIIAQINNIKERRDYISRFMVDIGNHWLSLIVYKISGICQFIILDSMGNSKINDKRINQIIDIIISDKDLQGYEDKRLENRLLRDIEYDDLDAQFASYLPLLNRYNKALQESNLQEIGLMQPEVDQIKNELSKINLNIRNKQGLSIFIARGKVLEAVFNLLPNKLKQTIAWERMQVKKFDIRQEEQEPKELSRLQEDAEFAGWRQRQAEDELARWRQEQSRIAESSHQREESEELLAEHEEIFAKIKREQEEIARQREEVARKKLEEELILKKHKEAEELIALERQAQIENSKKSFQQLIDVQYFNKLYLILEKANNSSDQIIKRILIKEIEPIFLRLKSLDFTNINTWGKQLQTFMQYGGYIRDSYMKEVRQQYSDFQTKYAKDLTGSDISFGLYDNVNASEDFERSLLKKIIHCESADNLYSIAWSFDESRIVVDNCGIKICDLAGGASLTDLYVGDLGDQSIYKSLISWSPDQKQLAITYETESNKTKYGVVKIWNIKTNRVIITLTQHLNEIRSIAWSPDGSKLAAISSDRIVVWNSSNWSISNITDGQKFESISWSPDSSKLAYVHGGNFGVYTVGRSHPKFSGNQLLFTNIAWASHGSIVALGSISGEILIIDISTGKTLKTLQGHTQDVTSLSWSADSKLLASSALDETIRIWDVHQGTQIDILKQNIGHIDSVVWSPKSNKLAAALGKTLHVWEMR